MKLVLGSQSPRRRELLGRMGLEFTVLTAEIDETKYETEDPEESVCRICREKALAVAKQLAEDPCHLSPVTCHLVLTADTIVVLDGKILGKPHSEAEARAMLRTLSGREHEVFTAFTLLPVKAFPLGPTGRGPVGDFNVVAPATPAQLTSSSRRCPSAKPPKGMACASEHSSPALPAGPHRGPGAERACTGADEGTSDDADAAYTHCEKTAVKFRALTEAEIAAYVASGEPMDKAGAYGIQGLGAMLVESIRGDYFTVMGLPICQLSQALKRYGIDPLNPES